MQNIELYIENQRVDLFDDESIVITDSIQNVRDISKVFTSFSKQFSVPASKTNNKIFKHFYNVAVDNGFDARIRTSGLIKMNGADYKNGRIKLINVALKDSVAHAYNLVFYGQIATLNEMMGDDELDSLPLSQYDHAYTEVNVQDGLELGLGTASSPTMERHVDADVVYPLISHTKRYVYDGGAATGSKFNDTTASPAELDYSQLKAGLKLNHIITAIQDKYTTADGYASDVTFTTDFFGDADFDELYMWMHRKAGPISGEGEVVTLPVHPTDNPATTGFDYVSGPALLPAHASGHKSVLLTVDGGYKNDYSDTTVDYALSYTITIVGSGSYEFKVVDMFTGEVVYEKDDNIATDTFVVQLPEQPVGESRGYALQGYVDASSGISSVDADLSIQETTYPNWQRSGSPTTPTPSVYGLDAAITTNPVFIISENIPKMKVIDFLTSLWRLFNLTAYVNGDGDIYVDTLDNFYALGSDIDITKYIDTNEHMVSAALPYNKVEFRYSDPVTLLAIERNERIGEEFGNLEYKLSNDIGEGKYVVKCDFEHLMFDRIDDANSTAPSNFLFGYFVDKDENPVLGRPLIFYNNGTQTSPGAGIEWIGVADSTSYQQASNMNGAESQSLNFNAEIDEWNRVTKTVSLFENFYKTYIEEVYNSRTKISKFKAWLPASFILTYNMYDKIVINGTRYKINSISINLNTGESDLELINEL